MASIKEIFGDLDQYNEKGADFDLLPENTVVAVKVEEIAGRKNRNGDAYVAVTSRVETIPVGLSGNFGSPRLWDHSNFVTPKAIDPTLPEDELKKARQRFGMWARRVQALGLDPSQIDTDWDAAKLGAFFAPAAGHTVLVKLRVEPAQGEYRAKNTARDYFPDTEKARKKYAIGQVLGSKEAAFDVEL